LHEHRHQTRGRPRVATDEGCSGRRASFAANNLDALGKPTDLGVVTAAVFDDTCGNLVQIVAQH
jgi:hypothetical protein